VNELWQTFSDAFYQCFIEKDRYLYFLEGFKNTVIITVFAAIIGIALGFVIAILKVSGSRGPKKKWYAVICDLYLTVVRGTPVMLQIIIMSFIVLASADKMVAAVIAFGLNSAAYVAEMVRGGIQAVEKGQEEAGRSLGLNYWSTMRLIILPQAIKSVLPALGNEFIVLLKETAVAGYIAVQDLTKGALIIQSQTYSPYMPLLGAAAVYLVVVLLLSWVLKKFERRLYANEQ
jgi:His/Glu/Gln/Arg/opine family amino acid ABC transporter permease subunit